MKLSSKGRYAVRIMAELAKSDGFISVAELSKKQDISVKYTEKIISILLKGNLITSVRGASGGYRLLRAPEAYSIREILSATDDLPKLAPCLEHGASCDKMKVCPGITCWEKLDGLITGYLEEVKLSDILS